MTVINVIDGENLGQWKMHVLQWKSKNSSVKTWYLVQWFEGSILKRDVFIEEALESAEE